MDDHDRLDDALQRLKDPAPCPARLARLRDRLRAPVARPAPWRIAASLAAGLLLVVLVGLSDSSRQSSRALPSLAAPSLSLPSPLPETGPQSIGQALATHASLTHPGLRAWWVRELQLSPVARGQLLRGAIRADLGARALALDWWGAHQDRAPLSRLIWLARREPAAVLVGVALARRLPGRRGERLLKGLALHGQPGAGLAAALAARRGLGAVPLLVHLLNQPASRLAAARQLDGLGVAVIPKVAALLGRTRDPSAILEYLARSRHTPATAVLVAALGRGLAPAETLAALSVRADPLAVRALSAWQAHPRFSAAAMAGLARSGDRGIAVLRETVRRSSAVRARRALEALAGHGTPAALRALVSAAAHRRYRKQIYGELAASRLAQAKQLLAGEIHKPGRACAALSVLVRQRDARLLPTLGQVLSHPKYARRALETIARIDDARAVGYLIKALSIPKLRGRAHRHLLRRTGQRLSRDPRQWLRWYRKASGTSV